MRAKHLSIFLPAVLFALSGLAAASTDLRLVEAVRNQDTAITKALLGHVSHADLNSSDAEGNTALLWAAHWDNLDVVKRLVEAGADVTIPNRFGGTPLHEAASFGDVPMMEVLLKAGANPDAARGEGDTPLIIAARTGVPEAVALLLAKGAAVDSREGGYGETPLMIAAAMNYPEVVRILIDHRADANAASTTLNVRRRPRVEAVAPPIPAMGGLTPLLFAARQDSIESAKLLIAAGADVNKAEPDYGFTPLLDSIFNNHYDFATLLVEKGADVKDGALYVAIEMRSVPNAHRPWSPTTKQDNFRLIQLLLDKGADPNAVFKKSFRAQEQSVMRNVVPGATPFHKAAQLVDVPVMQLLLAHGARPVPTRDGTTSLMAVAQFGAANVVKDTPTAPDSALDEAINLCLLNGVDINAVNAAGNSALHYAAGVGTNHVVQDLVDHGAAINVKNKGGQTPLDWAQGRRPGGIDGALNEPPHESTAALIQHLLNPTVAAQ